MEPSTEDIDAKIAEVDAKIKNLQEASGVSRGLDGERSQPTAPALDPEEMQFVGVSELASTLHPEALDANAQLQAAKDEYRETVQDPLYKPMITELRRATGDTVGHRQLKRAQKDVADTEKWLDSLGI